MICESGQKIIATWDNANGRFKLVGSSKWMKLASRSFPVLTNPEQMEIRRTTQLFNICFCEHCPPKVHEHREICHSCVVSVVFL